MCILSLSLAEPNISEVLLTLDVDCGTMGPYEHEGMRTKEGRTASLE